MRDTNSIPSEFEEKIIALDRVTRVVKGGRRFRFRATVVVGDGAGRVGVGVGKGGDAPTSIIKAVATAKKSIITSPSFFFRSISLSVAAYLGVGIIFHSTV